MLETVIPKMLEKWAVKIVPVETSIATLNQHGDKLL